MNLREFLDLDVWTTLVPGLLHTLWIGAVVAAVLSAALRLTSFRRAGLRYAMTLCALGLVVAGGAAAWRIEERRASLIAAVEMEAAPSVQETTAEGGEPGAAGSGARVASLLEKDKANHTVAERVSRDTASGALPGDVAPNANTRPAQAEAAPRRWQTAAGWFWLLGVALMLVRSTAGIAGTGRLRRHARVPEDPPLQRLANEVRRRLGIARRVTVLLVNDLAAPAVVGVAWPVIYCPLSMATGIPEAHLRAILAHELAHVKHWDGLLNVVQMLVEALLFFNPAVWWISRQVRLEREACCDAVAARLAGQPVDMARVLVEFGGRRVGLDAASPSLAGGGRHALLERVARLLDPGRRAGMRLSWTGLLAAVAIAAALLYGLDRTGVIVAEAIMSDAERIELVREAREEFEKAAPSLSGDPDRKTSLTLRVRTADGEPVPGDLRAICLTEQQGGSAISSVVGISLNGARPLAHAANGAVTAIEAQHMVQSGSVTVGVVQASGYAPWLSETRWPGENGCILFEADLEKGFPAQILVQDEEGRPLEPATVKFQLKAGSMGTPLWTKTTDTDGLAHLDNVTTLPLYAEVSCSGYENLETTVVFGPDQPAVLTMKSGRDVTGVVLGAETGAPIPGAELRYFASAKLGHSRMGVNVLDGEVYAVTDSRGRFTLDRMQSGWVYGFGVLAEGYERRLLFCDDTMDEILVELGPARAFSGALTNIPDKMVMDGKAPLGLTQKFELPRSVQDTSGGSASRVTRMGEVSTEVRNGRAEFHFESVFPADASLRLGDQTVLQAKAEELERHWEIDVGAVLAEMEKGAEEAARRSESRRDVEILLVTGEGRSLTPEAGAITAKYHYYEPTRYSPDGFQRTSTHTLAAIGDDGVARLTIPVPNKLELEPTGLVGFTFGHQWYEREGQTSLALWADIEEGNGPFRARVVVKPAGAVNGQVLEADGSPANDFRVSSSPYWADDLIHVAEGPASEGRYHAAPVPLGEELRLIAHRGFSYLCGPKTTLTSEEPITEIILRFPEKMIDQPVHVVDPDGSPIRGVAVSLSFYSEKNSFGSGADSETDENGQVIFEGLIPNQPEGCGYRLKIEAPDTWQPSVVEFDPGSEPLVVRLEKGMRVEGRLLDADGKPLPGKNVHAYASYGTDAARLGNIESDTVTDAEGRFVFTRLPAALMGFHVSGVNLSPETPATNIDPAKTDFLELRVRKESPDRHR